MEAAARTAVGAEERETSVQAASYETAADGDCSMLKSALRCRGMGFGGWRKGQFCVRAVPSPAQHAYHQPQPRTG